MICFKKPLNQPNFEFFAGNWQFFSLFLYIKEIKNQYRFQHRNHHSGARVTK